MRERRKYFKLDKVQKIAFPSSNGKKQQKKKFCKFNLNKN